MASKILGGYLLTYQEVADIAHQLGLRWNSDPEVLLGCRKALNRWMIDQDPVFWYFRLQPIGFKEDGKTVVKLIFMTDGTIEDKADPDFRFYEDKGLTANFRERTLRANIPEELFKNFVTVRNPEICFVQERYGQAGRYLPLGSRAWWNEHKLE
ncbi:hypothetical protein RhiJN_16621 [Ceratobasidium sp. AG-Ba]|nr:hypothetical protein RhiJN_16621 [Ceratobasidium sp. AG-Ba]